MWKKSHETIFHNYSVDIRKNRRLAKRYLKKKKKNFTASETSLLRESTSQHDKWKKTKKEVTGHIKIEGILTQ